MIDMTGFKDRGVIGFDLRMAPESNSASLEKAAKEQRFTEDAPDILISADPSVLRSHEVVGQIIEEYASAKVISLWNPLGLANRLPALVDECHARGISTDGFVPLALTCRKVNFVAFVKRYGPGWLDSLPTEEELVGDGWRLLGFDVLDLIYGGLISGLSDCGYTDIARDAYRRWFGAELNKFGLFKSFSVAQCFAEARGMEIPEHAPFVVVGVLAPDGAFCESAN